MMKKDTVIFIIGVVFVFVGSYLLGVPLDFYPHLPIFTASIIEVVAFALLFSGIYFSYKVTVGKAEV